MKRSVEENYSANKALAVEGVDSANNANQGQRDGVQHPSELPKNSDNRVTEQVNEEAKDETLEEHQKGAPHFRWRITYPSFQNKTNGNISLTLKHGYTSHLKLDKYLANVQSIATLTPSKITSVTIHCSDFSNNELKSITSIDSSNIRFLSIICHGASSRVLLEAFSNMEWPALYSLSMTKSLHMDEWLVRLLQMNLPALKKLKLSCSDNHFSLSSVANTLSDTLVLEWIELSYDRISYAASAKALLKILGHCNSLKFIDLSYNSMEGDDAISYLAELSALAELNLSHNCITKVPCASITGISYFSSLKSLDLSYNLIRDKGLKNIKDMRALEKLNLSSNRICGDFSDYFDENSNLAELNLDQNPITTDGFAYIQRIFEDKNLLPNLKKLSFDIRITGDENGNNEPLCSLLDTIADSRRMLCVRSYADIIDHNMLRKLNDILTKNSFLQYFCICCTDRKSHAHVPVYTSMASKYNKLPEMKLYNKVLGRAYDTIKSGDDNYYDVLGADNKNEDSSLIYRDTYHYIDDLHNPSTNPLWTLNFLGMMGVSKSGIGKTATGKFLHKTLLTNVGQYLNPISMMSTRLLHYGGERGDTHLYTEDDISTLLRHYLPGTNYSIIAQAQMEDSELITNNVVAGLGAAMSGSIVLMPILVNNNHWVGVLIRQIGETIQIIYTDPLGISLEERSNSSAFIAALTNLSNFGINLEIIDLAHTQQSNGFDCGRFVVNNLVTMARMAATANIDDAINSVTYETVRNVVTQRLLNDITSATRSEYHQILLETGLSAAQPIAASTDVCSDFHATSNDVHFDYESNNEFIGDFYSKKASTTEFVESDDSDESIYTLAEHISKAAYGRLCDQYSNIETISSVAYHENEPIELSDFAQLSTRVCNATCTHNIDDNP